jgi:formylglycine-generating enzyme required for sulfatase activity
MMPLMRVYLVAVCAASMAACIQANRQPSSGDITSEVGAETQADSAADSVEDSAPVEVDSGPVECRREDECDAVADPCREKVCVDNHCLERAKEEGGACDDGLPCTDDAQCVGGLCVNGLPVVDGTPCDQDELVCNGVPTCQDGQCSIALPPSCPLPVNQCASAAVCSEDADGQCVDVPAEDGLGCSPPDGASAEGPWSCSGGRCVPGDMVFVPRGLFTMGCPAGWCDQDNGPEHEVEVSAFAIDVTELSEEDFRRCIEDADGLGFMCLRRPNEGEPEVTEQSLAGPARWIDWNRAETACRYFGKRLCTEAEWEYAARGMTDFFYPWGNLPPNCARATFFTQGGPGCGSGGPTEVGSKPQGASSFGAFEMAGNVAEWVADHYRADLYASRVGTPTRDPIQSFAGVEAHVVRGGSFRDGVDTLRVFARAAEGTANFADDIGVRCCLTLEDPSR